MDRLEEQMQRCRAAVVVVSTAYMGSEICKDLELPFLLWRMVHHNEVFKLFLIHLQEPSDDVLSW